MDSFFKSKRALVTGAGKGIGRDIAVTLYKRGAQTVALSRTQADMDSLKEECPGIQTVTHDVANWTSTRAVISNLGHFDLLVNNAAVGGGQPFLDYDLGELNRMLDVNFKAVFNISQVVARGMVERGQGGAIVHMSSMASKLTPAPSLSVYTAAKGALDSLAQAMALELGPHKIRVNCVNPGLLMTNLTEKFRGSDFDRGYLERTSLEGYVDECKLQNHTKHVPYPKSDYDYQYDGEKVTAMYVTELSDVTNAVLFLLSDQAAMITGTTLMVDGGYTQR